MNPRVSRSSALRQQGDRLPDRQDRREARRRLHARRDPATTSRARRRPASSRPSTTSSPRSRASPSRSSRRRDDVLGPQMKSVGEAMAIGRTFKEALQKAMRSLEIGSARLRAARRAERRRAATSGSRVPNADRLWYIGEAFRRGMTVERGRGADRDRPVVPRATSRRSSPRSGRSPARALDALDAERAARAQAGRASPTCASRALLGDDARRTVRAPAQGARRRAGLQDGRHLRRRVRGLHAVPLLDLRRRGRERASRRARRS